ncbi:633_t:CDS:2 [Dentiscutata erythropus]|uniref:633_t:CDS:1 n=1 Tax=Dentiscutata erythropus TaxID=1348616 RepID=A0A9N9P638_9GLOM|nr:633_t:CDS:2 [Dentiscutata erythropus]
MSESKELKINEFTKEKYIKMTNKTKQMPIENELLNSLNIKIDTINESVVGLFEYILQRLADFDKRIQDLEEANLNRIASHSAGLDECSNLKTTSDEPNSIHIDEFLENLNKRIQNLEMTNLNPNNP